MASLDELAQEIDNIKSRNTRVETDKVWESSLTRRVLLVIFTYLSISLYLKFILGIEPWLNAVIPSLGFLLSTLTLSFFKSLWLKYLYK